MSDMTFYPHIRRMILQIKNPPSNVSRFGNLNAFFFTVFVVFTAQVEKSGMSSPDGYAALPLIAGTIIFLFISMIVEIFVGMSVVVAGRWRQTMPDFLSIGILKGVDSSESLYRDSLVQFYHNQEINITITTATLVIALLSLGWGVYTSLTLGYFANELSVASAFIASLAMTAHLAISYTARRKGKKWAATSDDEIRERVHVRFKNHPGIEDVVPSVDELEDLLEEARRSNQHALGAANYLESLLRSDARRVTFLAVIIGICTILILL
jgi:hypothetical protein